jgi:hypothetical protein
MFVLYFTSKGRALLFRGGPGVEISRVSYVCCLYADIRKPGKPKLQSPKLFIQPSTDLSQRFKIPKYR